MNTSTIPTYKDIDATKHHRGPGAARRWLEQVAAGPPTDACVLWPYKPTETGYGRLYFDGRQHMASHVVLELSGRPRPFYGGHHGAVAMHSCDTPACCNPRHLRWATQAENAQDMANKRRAAHGERAGGAKLTEANVREIRGLYATGGHSQRELGERYGVSAVTISHIVSRKTWAHVE